MAPKTLESDLTFHGANWEDLNRLVSLAKFQFLQDDDYDDNHPRRCACLAASFSGPALDWVSSEYANRPTIFDHFDVFVIETRQAFGVADNNIEALCRKKLDDLQMGSDVPVFFAEFDRLLAALGITGHGTKIAMLQPKLPAHIKKLWAEQALSFANYDTMRERLNCMWALSADVGRGGGNAKKPRCGSCGRKGHKAADCRTAASKN